MFLCIGLTAGLLLSAWWITQSDPAISHAHTGPTLEGLRELSELVTLTVDIADVQETRIDGHVGGIGAILIVKGDVQIGIDLSAARFERIDVAARNLELVLPGPTVSRPRLDHDRSHLYAMRQEGLWMITPGDRVYARVTDRAWEEAQRTVAQAASNGESLDRSRHHAEQVLRTWFGAIAWNVTFRWPGLP